jgi:hypothetical protein
LRSAASAIAFAGNCAMVYVLHLHKSIFKNQLRAITLGSFGDYLLVSTGASKW